MALSLGYPQVYFKFLLRKITRKNNQERKKEALKNFYCTNSLVLSAART
jgi:hypothetical protein